MQQEAKKVTCVSCTYLNWPSSSKCVMCREPLTFKEEHATDIYRLGSKNSNKVRSRGPSPSPSEFLQQQQLLCDSPSSPSATLNHMATTSQSKWACHMCTYLNWPRSNKCVQCLTTRSNNKKRLVSPNASAAAAGSLSPRASPPAVVVPPISALESLRISNLSDSNNERNSRQFQSVIGSGHLAISSGSGTSLACSSSHSDKWTCPACTYDNWQRSLSCVICGSPQGGKRDTPSPPAAAASSSSIDSGASDANKGDANNYDYERRMRQLRRRMREQDWLWLTACMGVVEGDLNPVEAYLNSGGDPTRKLTNPEVVLLNRANVYETGHTLVHLAIKYHREDMLARLLSHFESGCVSTHGIKCVPSYVAPDLASAIRRHISLSLRQRKGNFPCFYINELATYSLPPEIEDLPPSIQEQLFSEVMDRDAQKELESDDPIINWMPGDAIKRLGCRLHALWNRSAGDCLLDSVLQATWGVFDRDNTLRRAMSDSLHEAGHIFYPRWREWEISQAMEMDFTIHESQLDEDWAGLLNLASQPGSSLEQVHIFCLAHVLRRPIIVYGVKYVKSWRGENLGYARFEGVYLPLLWDSSFCHRSPIALGYTRGHFCALVPPEPTQSLTTGALGATAASCSSSNADKFTFLPLVNEERNLLPVHFLSRAEVGREEVILKDWLDVGVANLGVEEVLVAKMSIGKPPLLVAQMSEEWLNHYRKLAQSSIAPFSSRGPSCQAVAPSSSSLSHLNPSSLASGEEKSSANLNVAASNAQGFSSDGDTDEE